VFDEAEAAREAGDERVILVNLCGHGHFDMSAYDAYHSGALTDLELSEGDMNAALERLPEAPALS
jgi:tryptophan synthase beta chain